MNVHADLFCVFAIRHKFLHCRKIKLKWYVKRNVGVHEVKIQVSRLVVENKRRGSRKPSAGLAGAESRDLEDD